MTTRYGDRAPKATDHWVPVSGGVNRGGYMNHCGGDCDAAQAIAAKSIQSPGETEVAPETAHPTGQLDDVGGVRSSDDREHAEGAAER